MSITAEKVTTPTLTYEQYLVEGEINRRYDILNGVRIWMANPAVRHQDVLLNIATAFRNFGREKGQGRVVVAACDVLITRYPLRIRQPDVLFISHARFGDRDPLLPDALDPAPELVVEILSPSDTKRVLEKKIEDYCAVHVRECWVVNMDLQTVEVLRLTAGSVESVAVYAAGAAVRSLAFPELSVAVSDIFAL